MKSLKLAVLAIGLVGLFGVGNAMAADTATIAVSANVLGTCAFDTTAYTMDFGAIDPTGADDIVNTNLAFTCTSGTNWALDDLDGPQVMNSVGGNALNYLITQTVTSGTGTGASESVLIKGTISTANKSGAAVDSYTDSLTINLIPTP